jgi:hypothetical protein
MSLVSHISIPCQQSTKHELKSAGSFLVKSAERAWKPQAVFCTTFTDKTQATLSHLTYKVSISLRSSLYKKAALRRTKNASPHEKICHLQAQLSISVVLLEP